MSLLRFSLIDTREVPWLAALFGRARLLTLDDDLVDLLFDNLPIQSLQSLHSTCSMLRHHAERVVKSGTFEFSILRRHGTPIDASACALLSRQSRETRASNAMSVSLLPKYGLNGDMLNRPEQALRLSDDALLVTHDYESTMGGRQHMRVFPAFGEEPYDFDYNWRLQLPPSRLMKVETTPQAVAVDAALASVYVLIPCEPHATTCQLHTRDAITGEIKASFACFCEGAFRMAVLGDTVGLLGMDVTALATVSLIDGQTGASVHNFVCYDGRTPPELTATDITLLCDSGRSLCAVLLSRNDRTTRSPNTVRLFDLTDALPSSSGPLNSSSNGLGDGDAPPPEARVSVVGEWTTDDVGHFVEGARVVGMCSHATGILYITELRSRSMADDPFDCECSIVAFSSRGRRLARHVFDATDVRMQVGRVSVDAQHRVLIAQRQLSHVLEMALVLQTPR